MKATIKTDELREATRKVNVIGFRRLVLPTYSETLLTAEKGKVTLRRTNLEATIITSVKADVDKPFSVRLPSAAFAKFLEGKDGNTAISLNEQTISIEREDIGAIEIPNTKADEFPPLPTFADFQWHSLDAKYLLNMLRFAMLSCATEESRPVLTGISLKDGEMASADGSRLTVITSDKFAFGLGDKQLVFPSISAQFARQIFAKNETVNFGYSTSRNSPDQTKSYIHFSDGDTTMISNNFQGKFPNYKQLIPPTFTCKANFSTPLLEQRLKMIHVEKGDSQIVRYDFRKTKSDKEIVSISANVEDTKYAMTMPVKIESKKRGMIAFNKNYVLDAIKPFSVCNLEITSPSSPGKFTGDVAEIMVLLMPMFVEWDTGGTGQLREGV